LAWNGIPQGPRLVFIDVGEGDATFVEAPGGTRILVDGGNRNPYVDEGERTVAPFLLANGISRLDYAVATHADADHMGGLIHIVNSFDVGAVLLPAIESGKVIESELLEMCARRGVPVHRLATGDSIPVAGAKLDVLHPPDWLPAATESNNQSLVLTYTAEGVAVLLPGDIEREGELRAAAEDCGAAILKAAHHGRATSTTEVLLNAVEPAVAVVSSANRLNHPGIATPVRRRLEARGIEILRTDQLGGLTLTISDDSYRFVSARKQRGYPAPRF